MVTTETPINIRDHVGLIGTIAKKYRHRGLEWDELLAEGYLALERAAEKFRPELGFKFTTYAGRSIHHKLIRALTNVGAEVPMADLVVIDDRRPYVDPGAKAQELERLLAQIPERESAVLRMRFGIGEQEPMSLVQVANVMGLTKQRIQQLQNAAIKRLRTRAQAEARLT